MMKRHSDITEYLARRSVYTDDQVGGFPSMNKYQSTTKSNFHHNNSTNEGDTGDLLYSQKTNIYQFMGQQKRKLKREMKNLSTEITIASNINTACLSPIKLQD